VSGERGGLIAFLMGLGQGCECVVAERGPAEGGTGDKARHNSCGGSWEFALRVKEIGEWLGKGKGMGPGRVFVPPKRSLLSAKTRALAKGMVSRVLS
jgi:hypothetical protein